MIPSTRCIAAALSFLLLAAAAADKYQPYMNAQQLVDIGGRRLNLYCTGYGSPTVILDTDQDGTTIDWRFVQPAIAKRARVCSYDAAGLGFSDPAPAPRDAGAYMRDLHALLEHAGIRAPYVLVGYGFSALSDSLYADAYPRDVAGMVFVDPLVPYRNERLAELDPALKPLADKRAFIAQLRTCRDAARAGKLHTGTKQFQMCMWPTGPGNTSLPVVVRRVLQVQWQRPASWNDLIFASEADDKSSAEAVHAQRRYGKMPLVVLTSDVRADLAGMPLSPAQFKKIADAYDLWQRGIASLSTRGEQVIVAGSTNSNLATTHASAVVTAINNVIHTAAR